jgi:hypothetical protein
VRRCVNVEIEFGIPFSFEFQSNLKVSVGFFETSHCSMLSVAFLCSNKKVDCRIVHSEKNKINSKSENVCERKIKILQD